MRTYQEILRSLPRDEHDNDWMQWLNCTHREWRAAKEWEREQFHAQVVPCQRSLPTKVYGSRL